MFESALYDENKKSKKFIRKAVSPDVVRSCETQVKKSFFTIFISRAIKAV